MKHLRDTKLIKPLLLVSAVAVTLACSDYFVNDFHSMFYPEASTRPRGSDALFYTPQLYYSYDAYDFTGAGGGDYNLDSIIVDEWRAHLGPKISVKTIQTGLFEQPQSLITQLKKSGFTEEANYVTTIHLVDQLKSRSAARWDEAPIPADSVGLLKVIAALQQKLTSTKIEWLKARYAYTVLKAQAFAHNYSELIANYAQYKSLFSSNTILSDMAQSLYAGAFYQNNNKGRAFYEFSQLLTERPRLATRAVRNIRIYNMVFDPSAHERFQKRCNFRNDELAQSVADTFPNPRTGVFTTISTQRDLEMSVQHLTARL